jgi:uncharacterized phage protein gp47/JayE
MRLGFQNIPTLVAGAAAAIQGKVSQLLDLNVGSPLRAILEANASQISWQQTNILSVARAMRLKTATGSDVDSFVADFQVYREPPVAAVGVLTFSRYSPLQSAAVLVGSTARTSDGSQTVVITADSTNAAWSASAGSAGGYVLQAGVGSITVPAMAQVAGSSGNVGAGTITLLGDATVGVDQVTNASGFTGGLDAETDDALRTRFWLHIASLERATFTAVQSAIADVQQGLSYLIQNNRSEDGRFRPGHFVVILDDGSGHPSDDLKSRVYAAVDRVNPLTITFSVQSPSVAAANIGLTITVQGVAKASLLAPIAQKITAYANALPVGGSLSITRIAALAYSVDPGVVNVSNVTINNSTADFQPSATSVVKASLVTVS